jgi:hypothetical protein
MGNDQVGLEVPIAGAGRLEFVVREDLERAVEATVELFLKVLGKYPRAHD